MQKVYSIIFIIYFYCIYILVKTLTLLATRNKNGKGILYLELFGPPSAGYRLRSAKWAEILTQNGIPAEVKYLISYEEYKKLKASPNGNILLHIRLLSRRFLQCLSSGKYKAVIVRRELLMYNDYGSLFFENWMRKKHAALLLDVDDDIAAAKNEPRHVGLFGKVLKEHPTKFTHSLKHYSAFICGSDYLSMQLSKRFAHKPVITIPTCVEESKNTKQYNTESNKLILGWVGTSYNLLNLSLIIPYLEKLYTEHPFELMVICDEPFFASTSFQIKNILWTEEKETENLLQVDIGLMPLINNKENMGKSGLKLVQYMNAGIVSVASAYTVNTQIIKNGENGFLVNNERDWYYTLQRAVELQPQFAAIGAAAKKTIASGYTFSSNTPHYLNFIRNIVKQN